LNRPTVIEHEIASRIARTIDPPQNDTIDDSLVRMRVNTELKSHRKLIIHYTYEERLATYRKHIHQLWNQIFGNTPVTSTKLIVGNRNSPNAMRIFIRHRSHTILSMRKH